MNCYKWIITLMVFTIFCLPPLFANSVRAAEESAGGEEKRVVAEVGDDGVQRVEVVGGEYYFEPNHIVVRVHKPVELLVRKSGGMIPHNIIVKAPEAGIDFNVGMEGEFKPIRFTPTKTGEYEMYCDKSFLWFENHREKGMKGTIEVVE
ncbi:MAG: quinol oxidase [Desulfurivibrionaceae bacterium]